MNDIGEALNKMVRVKRHVLFSRHEEIPNRLKRKIFGKVFQSKKRTHKDMMDYLKSHYSKLVESIEQESNIDSRSRKVLKDGNEILRLFSENTGYIDSFIRDLTKLVIEIKSIKNADRNRDTSSNRRRDRRSKGKV